MLPDIVKVKKTQKPKNLQLSPGVKKTLLEIKNFRKKKYVFLLKQ